MLIFNYPSKKAIKEKIGQRLSYTETSFFGNEFPENGTGIVIGSNRPYNREYSFFEQRAFDGLKKDGSKKKAKEFFARVHVENGIITKVE